MSGERKQIPILKSVCLAILLALLAACRSVTPYAVDSGTAKDVNKGVRQMASAIARDLANDGPTAWLRYFDDTPGFFMAANGKLQFTNVAQARDFLPGFAAGVAHMELIWTDIRVDPIAPGMAAMGASYREVFTDKAAHANEYSGYFTGLAVKTSTGWKLRNAHWSSSPPPP